MLSFSFSECSEACPAPKESSSHAHGTCLYWLIKPIQLGKNENLHPTILKRKKKKKMIPSFYCQFLSKRIINVSKLDVIEENLKLLQGKLASHPFGVESQSWETAAAKENDGAKLAYCQMSFCSWPLHMVINKFWDGIHRSWRKKCASHHMPINTSSWKVHFVGEAKLCL